MAYVEKNAIDSVLIKLSSLRKTLSDEEQEVLDGFLHLPPATEVSLHQHSPGFVNLDTFTVDIDPETGFYEIGPM